MHKMLFIESKYSVYKKSQAVYLRFNVDPIAQNLYQRVADGNIFFWYVIRGRLNVFLLFIAFVNFGGSF